MCTASYNVVRIIYAWNVFVGYVIMYKHHIMFFRLMVPCIVIQYQIKIELDATVCRYLFTAKSLYMFRVLQHPSSGVLKTVTAASGTGHNIGTATSFQRGQIWPYLATWPRDQIETSPDLATLEGSSCWKEVAVPII